MPIELTLSEDIPKIAKSGDKIILQDDGKFEMKKADGTIIQKPFADYKDFADCVSKNKDKEDPNAYCGSIKHKIEDEVNKSNIEKTFDAWLESQGVHRRDYNLRPKNEQDRLVEEYNESQRKKSETKKENNNESYDERRKRLSWMQQPGYESKYDESGYQPKRKKDEVNKEYDPRIEKYLSIDKEKSWSILTKFYNEGHLDSYKLLKEYLNKIATCPDVTEKFEKIMDGWMKDGEADTSAIEKIIDTCKKEGGNVVREGDDKKTKMESIVKEILNTN